MGLSKSEGEGQVMAAALVEVDEVQVEATRGEPDRVKVMPEVIKLPTPRIYQACTFEYGSN